MTLQPRHLTAAILAGLLGLKLYTNLQPIDFFYDGGYYANIAEHVRDGDGFVTDISMYHQSLPSFPFPTPVYPLWPLVLGFVAKFVPLSVAAVWLPTAFYLGAVALFGRLTAALDARAIVADVPALRPSHLVMLLVALNDRFLEYTSRPYTEGLAWFLFALSLPRVIRAVEAPSLRRGVEVGAWCALWVLARGPMIVQAGTVFAALCGMLLLGSERRAMLAAIAGFCVSAVAAAGLLGWWYQDVPGATLSTLVRFDNWIVRPGLTQAALLGEPQSLGDRLGDLWRGFRVAYDPQSEFSYRKNFGYLQYALPVAAGWVAWKATRVGWLESLAVIFQERAVTLIALLGLGQFAAMHAIHKAVFSEWNFGMRHALGEWMLFIPCALLLLRRTGWLRLIAVLLVASTLMRNGTECQRSRKAVGLDAEERSWRKATIELVERERRGNEPLWVGTHAPQLLAPHTENVGWISLLEWTQLSDLALLHSRDGMSVIVVPDALDGEKYPFLADRAAFDAAWAPIEEDIEGYAAFRPREVTLVP